MKSGMTLTAYYQLKNTKNAGLGIELLDSEAAAFIVLEECSYEKPNEIAPLRTQRYSWRSLERLQLRDE